MDKKYTVIITTEDERYARGEVQLNFYGDQPWEGRLLCVLHADTVEELYKLAEQEDVEGLFYQAYENEYGNRIGYGIFESYYPKTDIEEFEAKYKKITITEGEDKINEIPEPSTKQNSSNDALKQIEEKYQELILSSINNIESTEKMLDNIYTGRTVVDSDTILADMLEEIFEDNTGIGHETFRIYKESSDKAAFNELFVLLTGYDFKEYVAKCEVEMQERMEVAIVDLKEQLS